MLLRNATRCTTLKKSLCFAKSFDDTYLAIIETHLHSCCPDFRNQLWCAVEPYRVRGEAWQIKSIVELLFWASMLALFIILSHITLHVLQRYSALHCTGFSEEHFLSHDCISLPVYFAMPIYLDTSNFL